MEGVTITGQGPAIVLLHSSLSSSKQWQGLVQKLSNTFTCINIDLLGYGNAPKVTSELEYNFDREVERIAQILSAAQIHQPYHLIGHSCGGAIALKIAVQNTQQILSLTLYEPVAFHLLEQENAHEIKLFADKLEQLDAQNAAEKFVDYWNGAGYFTHLPLALQAQMAAGMTKVKLDFHGIFAESYRLSDLAAISCPSLVMIGDATTAQSKQLSDSIAQALPNVQTQAIAAGHMAPLSHPQLVEPIIVDFLLNHP